MSCPHLKEVVMLFCAAYPVKKMVPLDRLATANPCLGGDFQGCALFRELSERLKACPDHDCAAATPPEPARGGTR